MGCLGQYHTLNIVGLKYLTCCAAFQHLGVGRGGWGCDKSSVADPAIIGGDPYSNPTFQFDMDPDPNDKVPMIGLSSLALASYFRTCLRLYLCSFKSLIK
jgi:hypothetical protein